MKLERATIRMGETIPTQQFANVRPEVEVTVVSTDNGQSYAELYAAARKLATELFQQVRAEMLGIKPATPFAAPQASPVAVPGYPPPAPPIQGHNARTNWPTSNGIPKVDPTNF